MSDLPGPCQRQQPGSGDRFPGPDVLGQARHRGRVSADLVTARLNPPSGLTFFTEAEAACAGALLNLLAGQEDDQQISLLLMVDARLAAAETDGWRYADMPEDGQAWRDTLAYADADAAERGATTFAAAPQELRLELIQAIQDLGSKDWHGLNAAHVWNLWTRYACMALYALPLA